jgi:hypothetical protein
MWERRGVKGGVGGVIYAEQALLPLPLALLARCSESRRVRREPASKHWEPGPAEGAPVRCLHRPRRSSRPLSGAQGGARAIGESGIGAGETQLLRAPAPLSHLQLPSRGALADRPAGRRAGSSGPRSPRDGLGAAPALRFQPIARGCEPRGCAPGRPRPEKLVVRAA